jgi:alpha-mannosidase
MVGIEDENRTFTVLTDRSEGSTSMKSGQLELMLHRRLVHGCRWGMCEPNADDGGNMESAGLNDTLGAEVLVKHWLRVGSVGTPNEARIRTRQLNYPPTLMLSPTSLPENELPSWTNNATFTPFSGSLPINVELTTWQALNTTAMVMRLTHMYQEGEDAVLSLPAKVDLCNFLGTAMCAKFAAGSVSAVMAKHKSVLLFNKLFDKLLFL